MCVEIRKGAYGLPQAGTLENDLLKEWLKLAGFCPTSTAPVPWRYQWRPIMFYLVVDDFGVHFIGKEHAKHLTDTLNLHYEIAQDSEGKKYLGIDQK